VSSIADTYTHLTNYSIQSKRNPLVSVTNKGRQTQQRQEGEEEEGELFSMQQQQQQQQQAGEGPSRPSTSLFETLMGEGREGVGAAGKLRSEIHTLRGRGQARHARPSSAVRARQGRTARDRDKDRGKDRGKSEATPQSSSSNSSSELLVTFDELLGELAGADDSRDGAMLWRRQVWPRIREKVVALLQATQSAQVVTPRRHSFEFLGFDVLLDEQCEPWILEVATHPRHNIYINMIVTTAT
jgi:hypothetical protein